MNISKRSVVAAVVAGSLIGGAFGGSVLGAAVGNAATTSTPAAPGTQSGRQFTPNENKPAQRDLLGEARLTLALQRRQRPPADRRRARRHLDSLVLVPAVLPGHADLRPDPDADPQDERLASGNRAQRLQQLGSLDTEDVQRVTLRRANCRPLVQRPRRQLSVGTRPTLWSTTSSSVTS